MVASGARQRKVLSGRSERDLLLRTREPRSRRSGPVSRSTMMARMLASRFATCVVRWATDDRWGGYLGGGHEEEAQPVVWLPPSAQMIIRDDGLVPPHRSDV